MRIVRSNRLFQLFESFGFIQTQCNALSSQWLTIHPHVQALYAMLLMFLTNGLTSLERVMEYSRGKIPQEAAWRVKDDPDTKSWPSAGGVELSDVVMSYRPGLEPSIQVTT